MKSNDLQNLVLSKYKDGQSCIKIYEDLHGSVGLSTVERWCKMIRNTGKITLFKSTGRLRTVRTAANIRKVKHRHDRLQVFSCRKIARDLRISRTSAQTILKDDLKLKSYRIKVQPKISEDQKAKRLKFANWIRTNFRKEDTLRFLFSDKKCSTLMEFITPEMRGSGRPVVPMRMRKVALSKYRNFLKKLWSGSEHVPKGCPLC